MAFVTVLSASPSVAPRSWAPIANQASAGALPTMSPPASGGSALDGTETSRLASSGRPDTESPAGPEPSFARRGFRATASSGLIVDEMASIALAEST